MREEKYARYTSRDCRCIWCSLLWSKLWQLEPICCDQKIQMYCPLEAHLSGMGTSNTVWCTVAQPFVFFLGWYCLCLGIKFGDRINKKICWKRCHMLLVGMDFKNTWKTDWHPILSRILTHSGLSTAPDFNYTNLLNSLDLSKKV